MLLRTVTRLNVEVPHLVNISSASFLVLCLVSLIKCRIDNNYYVYYNKFFIKRLFPLKCFLGPIIGGFLITSNSTWRTTFWFCFAFSLTVVLLILFVYPETYRENEKWDTYLPTTMMDINNEKAKDNNNDKDSVIAIQVSMEEDHDRHSTQSQEATVSSPTSTIDAANNGDTKKKKTLNPIKPFLYLRHPHVLLASLVMASAFGSMFTVIIIYNYINVFLLRLKKKKEDT